MAYSYIVDYADDGVQEFLHTIDKVRGADVFIDIETSGLNFWTDDILLLQAVVIGKIYIFDIRRLGYRFLTYIVEHIKKSGVRSVGHNIKFDIKFLYKKTGIMLQNVFDTMIAEVVLNAGIGSSFYSLEDLVEKYLGFYIDKSLRDSFFTGQSLGVFTSAQLDYAARDVHVLREIKEKQEKAIEDLSLSRVIYEVEMPLVPVTAEMELSGILLNQAAWADLEEKAKQRVDNLEADLKRSLFSRINLRNYPNAWIAAKSLLIPIKSKREADVLESITDVDSINHWVSERFNVASPQQIKNALNMIGIPVSSTDARVLGNYKSDKTVEILLSLREEEKLYTTYGKNFLNHVNPITGRIHTEFMNVGAATGRMSSTSPNMQNIPRSEEYRRAFIAEDGYHLATFDYSQQEYRALGAISGEDVIIDAYKRGLDMHIATASLVFDKPMDSISKEERSFAKGVNFALIYGSTAWGLKHNLDIPLEKAEEIVRGYYAGYPKLAAFKRAVENEILKRGYSTTVIGRKRFNAKKPDFMDSNELERYRARILREGFNMIIQGTCADIVKIAMNKIYYNNPFGDKLRLLLQVHDEICCEVHESVKDDAGKFIEEMMVSAEQPFLGEIPAVVEGKILPYWSK